MPYVNPFPNGPSAKPADPLLTIGLRLFGLCLFCLVLGRVFVSLVFPESRGQGIPPAALYFLIPVWILGGTGLILMLAGWLRSKLS